MQRLLLILVIVFLLTGGAISSPRQENVIEDFNTGEIDLNSFPGKDIDPDAWAMDSTNTYNDSSFSLKLYGNNWKILDIEPYQIDSNTIWQVACYVETVGGIHGFGVTDGENILMYSFAGEEKLDIEEWLTVYQGYYPNEKWNLFQLPVGDDWLAWHRYSPEITGLIFINDNDHDEYDPPGVVYFDYITDISGIIPEEPVAQVFYHTGKSFKGENGNHYFGVQFESRVFDPNFNRHRYYWDFGDGTLSADIAPSHIYQVRDDHTYTAFLAVENAAGKWGYASTQVKIPEEKSSQPVTMNFVGDVILARRYEEPGGIIPTLGVEAIFEPTRHVLGEAADITVINLEAPLTTSEDAHPTKGIGFKGNPENVNGLIYGGVDVASLGNNHVLDFMLSGLRETQNVLDEAGIRHLGAGANSYEAYLPAFVNKNGINIAFVASCDRTGQYNNYQPYLDAGYNRPGFAMLTPYYKRKQIESVRDVADLVVALLHSGSEYSREPISHYDVDYYAYSWMDEPYFPENGPAVPPMDNPKMWDRDVRHLIINSGADLLINHHPHIIQGLELYKGKLIAHSLGNFIFDSNFPETFPSMILNAEADKEGFHAFSVTPVYINDYIPQEATGELALYILDYLAARSREFDTYLHVDRDHYRAYVIMDTLHIDYYDIEDEGILVFDETEEELFRSQPMRFNRNSHPAKLHNVKPYEDYKFRLGRETVWFGNFEDEGSTLWNTDLPDIHFDENVHHEGQRSLLLTRDAGSGNHFVNMQHRVRIFNPDSSFTLHGWIKTENARNVNIEIRSYRTRTLSAFFDSYNVTIPISGTTDWTYFSKDIEFNEETRTADIFLRSAAPDSGTAYAWFDNVGIIEWEGWQPYHNNLDIVSPNEYYYIQMETDYPIDVAFLNYSERVYEQGFPPPPPTSVDEDLLASVLPAELHNNYPNPFNAETTIAFTINKPAKVELEVYNIRGQKVQTLMDEFVEPQPQIRVVWDGKDYANRDAASGVYFFRLKLDDKVIDTKKSLLLK